MIGGRQSTTYKKIAPWEKGMENIAKPEGNVLTACKGSPAILSTN